jgi:hypothetical protein
MNKLLTLLMFGLLFSACSSEQEEKTGEEELIEEQERKNYEQKKTNEINKLVSKYNIKYNWDTLSYEFSLEYKPIVNSGYQLATYVRVRDIFEKNGAAYALVRFGLDRSFYIEFPISKEQENKLISYTKTFGKCLMVVSISSIQKIKYEPAAVVRENEENASIIIDESEDFFGKGTIVDIVLISKKKVK